MQKMRVHSLHYSSSKHYEDIQQLISCIYWWRLIHNSFIVYSPIYGFIILNWNFTCGIFKHYQVTETHWFHSFQLHTTKEIYPIGSHLPRFVTRAVGSFYTFLYRDFPAFRNNSFCSCLLFLQVVFFLLFFIELLKFKVGFGMDEPSYFR